MQKALVLGATSFFGRHFMKKASEQLEITALNSKTCDLLTDKIYEFKDTVYDYIFHFSVKTEAGGYCQRHPGEQFLINQRMNTTVLDYWREVQPQAKLITFGSSCSYSDDIVKKEENYLLGPCESGYEVYGMVKRMLLIGLRALANEFDMQYTFYVPSCLYGADYDKGDKHFIYDILRKICDAKFCGKEPVALWGNGHQKRELIFVEDAVDVVLSRLDASANEIVNLSTGNDYSIRHYAKIICNLIDYEFNKIEFDVTKFVGAREKQLVVDKVKDFEFTPPEIGLKVLSDFYINNYMEKT